MNHLHKAAVAASVGLDAATAPTPGCSQRKRISAGPMATADLVLDAAKVPLSFNDITTGRSRLDGVRWFYELMVLSDRGLVECSQQEAYGDITVVPNLKAMAAV